MPEFPAMTGSLVLVTFLAAAAERQVHLAAPELRSHRLEAASAQYYSSHFAQQLALQGMRVVTSAEIAAMLGLERQRQLLGCSDAQASCTAELASALGVDGIVTGIVGKFDDGIHFDIKIVSAQDASALAVDSFQSPDEAALLEEMKRSAARVADQLYERFGVARKVRGTRGPPAAAWALGGVALASVAAGAILGYLAYSTAIARERQPSGPGYEELHRQVISYVTVANVCYAAAAAFALGAAGIWFFTSRSPSGTTGLAVAASGEGGMVFLQGAW